LVGVSISKLLDGPGLRRFLIEDDGAQTVE
jgi:hypothetical protein